ncbi:MAG: PilZ domain-containing protein [Candidatus Omnitrophica bacterium]|nr:PilZ domain-containing protein [Candidatus Omnitrophota bacterium]
MIPKLFTRKIGSVEILELRGLFADPWPGRMNETFNKVFEQDKPSGVLLNLREVEKIDHSGAEVILKTARRSGKGGILGQNLSAYFVAEHMNPNEPIPIFEKEREAIEFFKKEFAFPEEDIPQERRSFPRLETAMPLELEYEDFGESFFFEAVVTNLSEGGLYAYFLDSQTEELARRKLDPFDLKLLKLRFELSEKEAVEVEGKVIRASKDDFGLTQGIAMEFYSVRPEDGERISKFMKEKK